MNDEQRLRAFLQGRFPGFHENFAADAELSGVVDSLALFDVVDFVERDFGVNVPTAEFSPLKFSSIRRILDLVQELRSQ